MAGRKNHSPEEIVRLLQRFDELLAQGMTVEWSAVVISDSGVDCFLCCRGRLGVTVVDFVRALIAKS